MNKKNYKEQRVLMTVKQEYYIVEEAEQIAFIEKFAVNAKDFNYKVFMEKKKEKESLIVSKEKGVILDAKGHDMKSVN